MSKTKPAPAPRPEPRLTLVTPPVGDPAAFLPALDAALEAAEIAAVVLRLDKADERTLTNRIKTLAAAVQRHGAAALVEDHPGLATRGGADGAHLTSAAAFDDAIDGLKPDRIAGGGGLETRDDAMTVAENGADYVLFGEPIGGHTPSLAAVIERVGWWAELFEVPCVAYAARAEDVAPLAEAGADFVALGEWMWSDARGPGDAVRAAADALKAVATA